MAIIAGVLYGVNIAVTGVFTKKLDSGLYVFIQLAIQAVAAFGYSMIEKKILMANENMFAFTFQPLPLLTGLWSIIGGMETLAWNLLVGGVVILMAIFLANLGDKFIERHRMKKQLSESKPTETTCESAENIENKENKE